MDKATVDEGLESKLNMSIHELDLSVRATNCLESANVNTVRDLVQMSDRQLLELRSFGKTSLDEVKRKLADLGLSLIEEPEEEEEEEEELESESDEQTLGELRFFSAWARCPCHDARAIMRHGVAGKNLSRKTAHLVALRRNMASSLFEHGKVRTTLPKARHVQQFAERLITLARKGTLHARRLIIARMQDRDLIDAKTDEFTGTAVHKLFDEIAPKYADRAGGYTRIVRTSNRRMGDGGEIVVLQLVDPAEPPRPTKKTTNVTPRRRAAKARYALLERKSPKAAQPAAEAPATETPATEPPAPEAPKTDAPKE
jgi:large subunit ribosomal protein L17